MIQFHKRERSMATIHLTALIDIVFLLLIYFLLTSNFVTQEGIQVNLPKIAESPSFSPEGITITVDNKGRFYLDNTILDEGMLRAHLKVKLSLSRPAAVLIKADRDVVYEHVVTAMGIAKKAGAEKMLLVTETKVK